jgi:hypothetical protein
MLGGSVDTNEPGARAMSRLPSWHPGRCGHSGGPDRGPSGAAMRDEIPEDLPVRRGLTRPAAGTVEGKGGVLPERALRGCKIGSPLAGAALTNTARYPADGAGALASQ